MNEKHKIRLHRLNQFMNSPYAIILVLLTLFVYFVVSNHAYQVQGRNLLKTTNDNTMNTNRVVKGQTDILNAIKQLASDNKTDSNEKTNIIICMLQVPVAMRTTDLQEQCRKQVEAQLQAANPSNPGTLSSATTTPAAGNVSNSQTVSTTPVTSGNNTPAPSTPATPARDGITINLPLLPTIHIGSPF